MPVATAHPHARFATLLRSLTVAGLLGLACPAAHAGEDFSLSEESLANVRQEYGEQAVQRLYQWQLLIAAGLVLDDAQKLRITNDFFNRIRFVSDIDHWGREDYWATPVQMLASGGGDCEDFSIAKYFTLRQMGVPAERMRLTYVKALDLNQAHMVLTYFSEPDTDPLVLDNLVAEISTASNRSDLQPVYSFNGTGLWLVKGHGMDQHVGNPERLSRWKEVIARISDEQLALPH